MADDTLTSPDHKTLNEQKNVHEDFPYTTPDDNMLRIKKCTS